MLDNPASPTSFALVRLNAIASSVTIPRSEKDRILGKPVGRYSSTGKRKLVQNVGNGFLCVTNPRGLKADGQQQRGVAS